VGVEGKLPPCGGGRTALQPGDQMLPKGHTIILIEQMFCVNNRFPGFRPDLAQWTSHSNETRQGATEFILCGGEELFRLEKDERTRKALSLPGPGFIRSGLPVMRFWGTNSCLWIGSPYRMSFK
jgi:hypothetical protein